MSWSMRPWLATACMPAVSSAPWLRPSPPSLRDTSTLPSATLTVVCSWAVQTLKWVPVTRTLALSALITNGLSRSRCTSK
ncbi:hypothetical protein D3C78_1629690 [compost metagenome]